MAANLARAGFELSVYTRTREKAERFAAEHGARAAATPREAAEGASAVITMVPDAPEVEEVLLGEQGAVHGLDEGAPRDRHVHDRPHRGARDRRAAGGRRRGLPRGARLGLAAQGRGRHAHDHGRRRARPTSSAPARCSRRWASGSSTWARAGHAQLAKLLTNTMGAVHAAALAESVLAAESAGLDPDAFLEVAAGSAGNSTVLGLKGRPMFERDFTPLFKLEHMLKDVRHCLDEARALGVELRLGSLVEPLFAKAADAGHARRGLRRGDPGNRVAKTGNFP